MAPVTFPARSRHRIIACPCWKSANYNAERKMVLPVKVSIDRATCLVHTVDITHTGKLGAFRTELQPGMM